MRVPEVQKIIDDYNNSVPERQRMGFRKITDTSLVSPRIKCCRRVIENADVRMDATSDAKTHWIVTDMKHNPLFRGLLPDCFQWIRENIYGGKKG